MTRSASTLGYSKPKSFRRNTINIESPPVTSYASSSPPRSPPRIKSPTSSTNSSTVGNNFRSRSSSIDYELNDLFRSIVDDLCAIFVDARQSGLNEQQTVEILLVYFNHRNQDPTQIFEWLQNKTHKYKYTTLLGYFYDQGIGTTRNQRKAYCLYLSAAKKDYSVAQDLLGDCYYSGQGTTRDRNMAFSWYQKAADNDSTGSQFSLGICYAFGEGTARDCNKAFQYYKRSASGGNVSGINELGYCYEVGIGTKKDSKKAFMYFEQAANGGNPPGQHNLASCYEEGKGTPEDVKKAIYWYQRSADNGHEVAKKRLKQLLTLIKEQGNEEEFSEYFPVSVA
ncbi:hypothetical protein Glove_428g59 [Diversispora epigaea]|uniref:HCP-like protein n=1 Tax=Diversispora epigaea TaxID=1348612 RepID=A0A397GXR6_9GLOM|nr:hypothetical protein Glove_428g59 [Diversispora epigaea]